MNLNKDNFQEKVLERIRSSKIKMRSRYYFLARTLLCVVAVIMVLSAVVYLVSFVLFVLKVQGVWYLPNFGLSGLYRFLMSFPWLLAGIVLIFVLLLELFIKKVKLVYRKPLLYSVLGVTLLSLVAGFFLAEAPFHRLIFEKAREDEFPIVGPMYRGYGHRRFSDMYHGQVVELTGDSLKVNTIRGEDIIVNITPQTRTFDFEDIGIGDNVVVVGELKNGEIEARGIKVLPAEKSYFPKHPPRHLEFFKGERRGGMRYYFY